jgi:pimeloyl-ACP methyl ester carboxylesterase
MRTRLEKVVTAGDGTRLYARMTAARDATGDPLICANGIGVSTIFWRHIEEHFSRTRPVICFDYRGHGESEFPRDLDGLTMEANADDLRRVLDAFGHERAVLLGHSMGCQVIYTFAHRHPTRALGLVPILGTHGHPVHTFLDLEVGSIIGFLLGQRLGMLAPEATAGAKARLLARPCVRSIMGKLARLTGIVDRRMPDQDLDAYLRHMGAMSPVVFLKMAACMAAHSAGPYLRSIHTPTLVVAGERDVFTPMWCSEEIVREMPRAKLLVLREGSHAALVEQPEAVRDAIEGFLAELAAVPAAPAAEAAAA